MTTPETYNIQQLQTACKSYEQEVCKLLAVKADKDLTILNLRNDLAKKEKRITELERILKEKEVIPTVTIPVNGKYN